MRVAFSISVRRLVPAALLLALTSCTTVSNMMNPFYESPKPVALLGEKSDKALNDGGAKADSARQALEAMSTYKRAHDPQPNDPVMQPAIVRLMWVPDHLNRNGDLVPAHYYYLKVKSDSWAVSDAFELEQQLNGPRGGGGSGSSNIPYINADEKLGH